VTLNGPADASALSDSSPTFEWDPAAGASETQIQVTLEGDFSPPNLDELVSAGDFTPGFLGDGLYSWRARGHNTAGGCDTYGPWSSTRSVWIDTAPPGGALAINGGAAFTGWAEVSLAPAGSDSGSGLAQARYANAEGPWTAWEPYTITRAWTLEAGDGVKMVQVEFQDAAGNVSTPVGASIGLDTTAPTGLFQINGGAAYTTALAATLDLAAVDAVSGVALMRFSADGLSWSDWEPYAAARPWTLQPGDGLQRVYAQVQDAVGNLSKIAQASIILDSLGPEGDVQIEGDAGRAAASLVTLVLWANDAGSAVAQMRFSNDGSAWSAWEPFAAARQWLLSPGDGAKTVIVQFRDLNGNVSQYSAATFYDGTPPLTRLTAPAFAGFDPFAVSWSAQDLASEVVGYDVQYRLGPDGAWTDWLTGTQVTSAVFDVSLLSRSEPLQTGLLIAFRARALDAAGNQEPYPEGDGQAQTRVAWGIFLPVILAGL
jgi:hypothetical protein